MSKFEEWLKKEIQETEEEILRAPTGEDRTNLTNYNVALGTCLEKLVELEGEGEG